MPKRLPDSDFRSRRIVLTRGDFALAPEPDRPPSDLVDKATWNSIMTLPDDVAIRTSNCHGTTLKQIHDLWGAWVECFGEVQDCLFPAMLDAGDDFQSAAYNALTGFYRLSISALRSALELTTIGTWAQVCGKTVEFDAWQAGQSTLSFGQACDGLIAAARPIEEQIKAIANDSLFDQKTTSSEGGLARRIFDGISNFTHARPGYTDAHMRSSNGPIYVQSVFSHVSWIHFETMGLCFVLLLLARPKSAIPRPALDLFDDANRNKSRATRAAFEVLYQPAK